MAHKVETAPSGRAACRGCKAPIVKGSPRFAEEYQNPYSDEGGLGYRYWHLGCAAAKLANEVAAALVGYDGPVDDRASIDAIVAANLRPEAPYAERAGSGRARCRACEETIKKGELRFAFERVFESPAGAQKSMAYVHPACTPRYLEREKENGRDSPPLARVLELVAAHSKLEPADLETVQREARLALGS
jgi:hypothetical protein